MEVQNNDDLESNPILSLGFTVLLVIGSGTSTMRYIQSILH
jgi:hypothetical protein